MATLSASSHAQPVRDERFFLRASIVMTLLIFVGFSI